MTTYNYSSVVDHTTDAGFRAWGSAFSAGLALAGLTQTTDTGQINWTTVTRPAVNTVAGYEIWRNVDSSIYMKFEFGTAGTANAPQMFITTGTGSNGTGTITGQTNTRGIFTVGAIPTSTATNYTTYMSSGSAWVTIVWAQNGFNTSLSWGGALQIHKTVDSNGAATTDGLVIYRSQSATSSVVTHLMQTVRYLSTAKTFTESADFAVVPGSPTASEPAGTNQAWPTWANIPEMRMNIGVIIYITAEIAENNTFSVVPIGTTSVTYFSAGRTTTTSGIGPVGARTGNPSDYSVAFRYE